MSFFDSKEEVINIELTQYGKYLLSKGKFDPKYYAFFDDDILYDINYTNVSESQNNSQDRILNQTPLVKPQICFTSVENTVKEQNELLIKENITSLLEEERELIANPETNYSAILPLGKSSYNSNLYPAWNVSFIKGKLESATTSSANYEEITMFLQPNLKIPQLELVSGSAQIKVSEDQFYNEQFYEFLSQVSAQKLFYAFANYDNTIFTLDILEKNVDDNKENFDVEFFIEEEKTIEDGSVKKEWRKLSFFKKPTNIKNNILLDNYLYNDNQNLQPDISNVEYYFDVSFDQEIADLPPDAKIALNIYDTNITEQDKPFGDNC